MTIFCWLPPLKLDTGRSRLGGVKATSAASSRARRRLPRRRSSPSGPDARSRSASLMLKTEDWVSVSPSARRSPGTRKMPFFSASRGLRERTSWPSMTMVPLSARSTPNSALDNSSRPEPTRPKIPMISPCRTSKSTPSNTPGRRSLRTDRATAPDGGQVGRGGKIWPTLSPSISSANDKSFDWMSAASMVAMRRPPRNTVKRSAISITSSSRWVM